jgi:predicted TIM-barrel fold metal-dependent hydrolase
VDDDAAAGCASARGGGTLPDVCGRPLTRRSLLLGLALGLLRWREARAAEPYRGPLIDAHSHLPGPKFADRLIAAMDRHRIERVALLGVGGVQRDDPAWIAGAVRRFPDRVLAFVPVPDPLASDAGQRLDAALATGRFHGAGEVHVHQASRKIRRAIDAPAFLAVLDACARHGRPLVIHDELDAGTTTELERALQHNRRATVVLAHAGSGDPRALADLLGRHENLWLDLSGMHFLRRPALAREDGPLAAEWKALIVAFPGRVLAGVDLWAPALYEPAMLDRLLVWTRRVLGELPPGVATQVAHANAVRLLPPG